jgi:DNA repair exonuclease SbcCD nuclease subunit
MKHADAILSADWHLREDQPEAWTEDYREALGDTLDFVNELQQEHECPILVAGDLFDRHGGSLRKWVSPGFQRWVMEHLPQNIWCVPGQHDLPQHNINAYDKSCLAVLEEAGRIRVMLDDSLSMAFNLHMRGFPYGAELTGPEKSERESVPLIALVHAMTFRRRKPYPGCEAPNGNALMDQMKGFDLIVTGDNHQPFTVEKDGRLLVNSGSLMRMTAAQIDHEPRVYLWDAETNTVEPVFIPQREGALSRDHIEKMNERDDRIDAFVEALEDDVEIGLCFEDNLKSFLNSNKTNKAVQDIVWQAVEA